MEVEFNEAPNYLFDESVSHKRQILRRNFVWVFDFNEPNPNILLQT